MDYISPYSVQDYAGYGSPNVEACDHRQPPMSESLKIQRVNAARKRYRQIPDETQQLVRIPKPILKTKSVEDGVITGTKFDNKKQKYLDLHPEKKLLYSQHRKERRLREKEILLQAASGADPTIMVEAEKIRAQRKKCSGYQKTYLEKMAGNEEFHKKKEAQRKMKKSEMAKKSKAADVDDEGEE